MNDHQDVPIGWRVFCVLLIATPVSFLILSWFLGETSTTRILLPFTVVAVGWFLLWGRKRRSMALHVIVGCLLTHQTYLLASLSDVESIGIVWFTTVPALVALLGNRNHIFLWTPITLLCVIYCWAAYAKYPYMGHPLSLPNLIGCTLLISAAAYGIVADRDRREASLRSHIEMMRAESAERKLAEKEATAARDAMSTFLASLSHEVRNPLTSIVLSADLLSLTVEEEQSLDSIRTIRQSADSLMLVVNDVMELAKSDVGAIQVQEEPFRLDELFDSVLRTVGPMFQGSDVRLFAGVMPDMPAHWIGDQRRIRQVVVNLVSNALNYARGTAIWVCAHQEDTGLRFEVGDNGCGISEQDQQRIFQPFQRLEQSYAEAPRGAGLGLAISRGYVRAMGGKLTVQSELGKGSIFQFDVVSDCTDESTVRDEYTLSLSSDVRFGGVRDDVLVVAQWAAAWLQSWGATEEEGANPFVVEEHVGNPFGCIAELRSAVEALYAAESTQLPKWNRGINTLPQPADSDGTILLCDDEAGVRSSVARILKLHGFEVLPCETGSEVLELIQAARPDVAFLDVQLATENGVEILRQMRRLGHKFPVCMLSGSMHHRAEAMAAGATEYLLKPPDSSELLNTIKRLTDANPQAT